MKSPVAAEGPSSAEGTEDHELEDSHRLAVIIEGVRLEEPTTIFGVLATPVRGVRLDTEVPDLVSTILEEVGFVTRIPTPMWAASSGPRRPITLVTTPPGQFEGGNEYAELHRIVARVVDTLVLLNGGAARTVGGALEVYQGGRWRTLAIEVGGPQPTGRLIERLAPDGYTPPAIDSERAFLALYQQPQLALWAHLYSGIAAEEATEVRVFRLWSLLEAIANACVPSSSAVFAADGSPIVGPDGEPGTTSHSRGRVYSLLQAVQAAVDLPHSIAVCHPDHTLWDDVGIWKDMRDLIAHYGAVPVVPTSSDRGRERRVIEATERAARSGGNSRQGLRRYADHLVAHTEAVLLAAIDGHIGVVPET